MGIGNLQWHTFMLNFTKATNYFKGYWDDTDGETDELNGDHVRLPFHFKRSR
jgi:hypothetical protein